MYLQIVIIKDSGSHYCHLACNAWLPSLLRYRMGWTGPLSLNHDIDYRKGRLLGLTCFEVCDGCINAVSMFAHPLVKLKSGNQGRLLCINP